jgi:HlyD family secretion protein
VTIGTVARGAFEDFAAVRGAVAPYVTYYLTTDQGGSVKQVLVEDGSVVKAGQPIVALSNPTLQLEVAAREADTAREVSDVQNTRLQLEQSRFSNQKELLEIQYQIKALKADIERDQRLFDAGAIAKATFDKDKEKFEYEQSLRKATVASFAKSQEIRKKQLAQLQETLRRLNDNLATARLSLDALTIRAPMDGRLTALDAEVGQSKAHGAVLGQVDTLDRFKLTADVDEFYLGRVMLGQSAIATIGDRDARAKVAKIYPQVSNGTFKADFTFEGASPKGIHTGQAIELKLELGGATKALLLPNGPFYQDGGGTYVFIVSANGRYATRRPVKLGRRNPEYVEVLEGLAPGDRVVISGYDAYKDIDKVKFTAPEKNNS